MSIPTKIYTPSISDVLTQFEKDVDEYVARHGVWPSHATETIHIVAGNLKEFRAYVDRKLAENSVNKYVYKYVYVRDRYTLMGISHIKGYYIGTAFQRKDIDQIKQAIAYVKERGHAAG